jgi:hypothetical protein
MLTRMKRKYVAAIAGVTLIELVVTMFIAGIALSGLVVAYTDGLLTWRRASDKMVIYSEGAAVLSLITRLTQRSGGINTYTSVGVPSHRMDLSIPVRVGRTVFYRSAQFYYYSYDCSLRWNNMTGSFNAFNQKLLPMTNIRPPNGESPYLEIQEASFTPYVPPTVNNPSTDCFAVEIKLVLNDARGDTITLSSIVSKRNPPD